MGQKNRKIEAYLMKFSLPIFRRAKIFLNWYLYERLHYYPSDSCRLCEVVGGGDSFILKQFLITGNNRLVIMNTL